MSTPAATGGDTWHGRFSRKVMKIVKAVKEEATKAGREDPRKVVHSLKVGMALTIASLIYLLEPFFNGMGQNSIWTVLTVILVLEFTAGMPPFLVRFLIVKLYVAVYGYRYVSVFSVL